MKQKAITLAVAIFVASIAVTGILIAAWTFGIIFGL